MTSHADFGTRGAIGTSVRRAGLAALAWAAWGVCPREVLAYIDSAPALGRIVQDAESILLLQVEGINLQHSAILYRVTGALKGKPPAPPAAPAKGALPAGTMKHRIVPGFPPREPRLILDWAEPGARAIGFRGGNVMSVCTGSGWYQAAEQDGWWTLSRVCTEFSLAYSGSIRKLSAAVTEILAGRETIVTAVAHGTDRGSRFFDVVLKSALRGRACPLNRQKAGSMRAGAVHQNVGSGGVVGPGAAGPEDVGRLLAQLKQPEVEARLDAADDLATIEPPAKEAVEGLTAALRDTDPRVRVHAAAALMAIVPASAPALAAFKEGLGHAAARIRKEAALLAVNLKPEAGPLAPLLVERLRGDSEARVRRAAAIALGEMGPEAAGTALAPAVTALAASLKHPELRGAATEALGGFRSKAAPAVPVLTQLLADPDESVRLETAVAMARIGTPQCAPAAPILLDFRGKRNRYDGSLFLAVMGPAAKIALPVLEKENDYEYTGFTQWSIDPLNLPAKYFRGDIGGDGGCVGWWAASYVHAMGEHRHLAAVGLANAIVRGQVNSVRGWAADLLKREAGAAVPALVKGLKTGDAAAKVRICKVLQTIGPAAGGAAKDLAGLAADKDKGVAGAAEEAVRAIAAKP
jgi:HEAT repeat protein